MERWIKSINDNLGEDIKYEDVNAFDFLGEDRYLSLLAPDKFDHESGEPEFGAVEVIDSLMRDGCPVYIISASAEDNIPAKTRWLQRHFPMLGRKSRIWTHEKYKVASNWRILIDDATHNLEDWYSHGGISVAIDRPWNQDWEGDRVKDFYELNEFIRSEFR